MENFQVYIEGETIDSKECTWLESCLSNPSTSEHGVLMRWPIWLVIKSLTMWFIYNERFLLRLVSVVNLWCYVSSYFSLSFTNVFFLLDLLGPLNSKKCRKSKQFKVFLIFILKLKKILILKIILKITLIKYFLYF